VKLLLKTNKTDDCERHSSLVATEKGEPVGIITERDVLRNVVQKFHARRSKSGNNE